VQNFKELLEADLLENVPEFFAPATQDTNNNQAQQGNANSAQSH
jgi:hypothetical protein